MKKTIALVGTVLSGAAWLAAVWFISYVIGGFIKVDVLEGVVYGQTAFGFLCFGAIRVCVSFFVFLRYSYNLILKQA